MRALYPLLNGPLLVAVVGNVSVVLRHETHPSVLAIGVKVDSRCKS